MLLRTDGWPRLRVTSPGPQALQRAKTRTSLVCATPKHNERHNSRKVPSQETRPSLASQPELANESAAVLSQPVTSKIQDGTGQPLARPAKTPDYLEDSDLHSHGDLIIG